jgi:uncharacterized membrane protein YoaK (UPF0700 family)
MTGSSEQADPQGLGLSDLGLALMALASGSTDVMAFLTLGDIFTSAMTGNVAFLAIAIGQGQLHSALLTSLALFGFIGGVMVATTLYSPRKPSARAVLRPLFAFEIACLAAFAGAWYAVDRSLGGLGLDLLIVLSAIAMGVQGVAARHVNAPGINTIVFTSTLVAIVMSITGAVTRPSVHPPVATRTVRQILILLTYAIGGLIAAFVIWRSVDVIQWIPLAAASCAVLCFELPGRNPVKS